MRNTLTIIALAGIGAGTLALTGCDSNNSNNITGNPSDKVKYGLNDTGVTQVISTNTPISASVAQPPTINSPPATDHPGQDANQGRDATANNDSDGRAGFSFTKLDDLGQPLANQQATYLAQPWNCVRDNVTGLIWEVKTTNSGLRGFTNKYTWYDPNASTNGGDAGSVGPSDKCGGLANCNTDEYRRFLDAFDNGKGLCGFKHWRVPTREELRSILDYGIVGSKTVAMIDKRFFNDTYPGDHWTSQTAYYNTTNSRFSASEAWEIHFDGGESESHPKSSTEVTVRLVHDME